MSISFSVNCPSLISSCLLIIFWIGLSIISRGFPSRFLKCSFYLWNLSSWLAALPSAHFIYCLFCYSRFSIFYWVFDFIDLALNIFLFFWYVLVLWAFFSFFTLAFVSFYLVRLLFSCYLVFSLIVLASHGTLHLDLGLVRMHSTAPLVSWWPINS